jgi:hypothetical protein
VYQAGSLEGIPLSLVPLLTACHEETVDALKGKVEALQSALVNRLQNTAASSGGGGGLPGSSDSGFPEVVDVNLLKTKLSACEHKIKRLEQERQDFADECERNLEDERNQV